MRHSRTIVIAALAALLVIAGVLLAAPAASAVPRPGPVAVSPTGIVAHASTCRSVPTRRVYTGHRFGWVTIYTRYCPRPTAGRTPIDYTRYTVTPIPVRYRHR